MPDQLSVRTGSGHGQDTKAAATIITQRATSDDGIAYSLNDSRGSWVARDVVARYVPAQQRPRDVFQARPQRINGQPWADECAEPARCLGNVRRIWVVRNGHYEDPLAEMTPNGKQQLLRDRYRVDTLEHPTGMTVALLVAT